MPTPTNLQARKLPHLGNKLFITDGGMETYMVFTREIDLPEFAAFPLLNSDAGVAELKAYYRHYIDLAKRHRTGLILDTPTWRASYGWGKKLGYSPRDIRLFNEVAVSIMRDIRDANSNDDSPMLVNGVIGPQDDGYNPAQIMDADTAQLYHQHQVDAFAESGADMVSAITMTYADEAIGITRAAQQAWVSAVISFTVETDGCLPDGTSLEEAITRVDEATDNGPVYYMVNCAHPTHFEHVLEKDALWMDRIAGIRANASCKSHAELDEATELDDGNPQAFGQQYAALNRVFKNLRVLGGCCGTDHRHVDAICQMVAPPNPIDDRKIA